MNDPFDQDRLKGDLTSIKKEIN